MSVKLHKSTWQIQILNQRPNYLKRSLINNLMSQLCLTGKLFPNFILQNDIKCFSVFISSLNPSICYNKLHNPPTKVHFKILDCCYMFFIDSSNILIEKYNFDEIRGTFLSSFRLQVLVNDKGLILFEFLPLCLLVHQIVSFAYLLSFPLKF